MTSSNIFSISDIKWVEIITDIEPVLDEAIFINNGNIVLSGSVEGIKEEKGKSIDELFREVFRW